MKLQRKYAIACVDLILVFLEDGYYPLNEMEGVMLGKILGFGQHHKMVKTSINKCRGWKEIGTVGKTARLDLTNEEIHAMLEIEREMSESFSIEDSELTFFNPTVKYLEKLCSSTKN